MLTATSYGRARRRAVAVLLTLAASAAAFGCRGPAPDTSATPSSTTSVASPTTTPPPRKATDADDWQVVGMSVQERPIRARTYGHGPRRVLFIGGIHGDEAEGAYTTDQLPAAFTDAGLADAVTLTIIEDANPDGRAAHTRTNANGVDVNRNFPARNFDSANGMPLSEPESRAVKETVDRINPALVMVAHSWAGRQFINFDGPARELADRFSQASGLPVEESSSFAVTPGSLGSYFGRDRGIAVLTIEVLKGSDPIAVWDKLRPAVLQAITG
ncbi:MAG: murein peptide amidase [Mycobacterium sp.]|jgi:hypothetical protein|nr:murein peptide amidase [Mycobacterium sp.]MDT5180776.1 murein peptide amidase [Mycobacterium sp.]